MEAMKKGALDGELKGINNAEVEQAVREALDGNGDPREALRNFFVCFFIPRSEEFGKQAR